MSWECLFLKLKLFDLKEEKATFQTSGFVCYKWNNDCQMWGLKEAVVTHSPSTRTPTRQLSFWLVGASVRLHLLSIKKKKKNYWAAGSLIYNLGTAGCKNLTFTTHTEYYLHLFFQETFPSTLVSVLAATLCWSRQGTDWLFQETTTRAALPAVKLKGMRYHHHLRLWLQSICWEDMHVLCTCRWIHATEDRNGLFFRASCSTGKSSHTAPVSVTYFDWKHHTDRVLSQEIGYLVLSHRVKEINRSTKNVIIISRRL